MSTQTDTTETGADAYYDPNLDELEFEENDIAFQMNDFNKINLTNTAIIRHYKKSDHTVNCYNDNYRYLHTIFKLYMEHCKINKVKPDLLRGSEVRRNRTAFIAQFQPHQVPKVKPSVPIPNWPTYAVSYEIEVMDDENGGNMIQICYREVSKRSFLSTVLNTYESPAGSEYMRNCLMIEKNPMYQTVDRDAIRDPTMGDEPMFTMRPCQMAILNHPGALIDKRAFLVCKHGWLAVFLKNVPEMYLLIENDYCVFPHSMADVVIAHKRVLDMNNAQSAEYYFRRSTVDQLKNTCNGMIVSSGVLHNEFQENTFSILGCGNTIINLTYFQQLLSLSGQPNKTTEDKTAKQVK